jgi:PAS domain S-box-containing protein
MGAMTFESVDDHTLARLVAEAADAVVLADAEGVVRYWNAAAEDLFGHSAADAVGASLDIIIPERLRARHWEGYRTVMATGETRYGRDTLSVPALHADGRRISVEFTVTLLLDDAGRVSGIAAIMRDVTTRWEEQRALQRRLAALENELSARPGDRPEVTPQVP